MKFLRITGSILVVALLTCVKMAVAQIDVQIQVLDVGTTDSSENKLHFGYNKLATYCLDPALGEAELPFVPPAGIADYRFVNHYGPDTNCYGNGTFKDYHHWSDTLVTDTFELDLQASTGASAFLVSWPAGLSSQFHSCVIKDAIFGFLSQDMLIATSHSFPTNVGKYYIIAQPIVNGVKLEQGGFPQKFALEQNYPNPFNPSTTITFAIQKAAIADVAIYDVLGRKVKTLASERLSPGTYSTEWNGVNDHGNAVSSGVYYARMSASDASTGQVVFSAVRKLLLTK